MVDIYSSNNFFFLIFDDLLNLYVHIRPGPARTKMETVLSQPKIFFGKPMNQHLLEQQTPIFEKKIVLHNEYFDFSIKVQTKFLIFNLKNINF